LLQVEGLMPLIQFVPGMIQTIYQSFFFAFYLFQPENTRFLALVTLSYLPAYFYYVRWAGLFSLKWQLPMQKAMIDQYTVLVEILINIPTIKAFNGYKAASLSFLAQVLQARCHAVVNRLTRSYRSTAPPALKFTRVSFLKLRKRC
jgi:hypothetical protein